MHLLALIGAHWGLAVTALAALGFAVVCPAAALPLFRALFTTRRGLIATTLALALGAGSWYGANRYAAGVHDTQASANAKVAAANLRASEAARSEERALAGVFHSTQVAYEQGKANAQSAVAGVLDAVSRGDYVLRSSLRCPRPAAAAATDPGAAAGATPEAGGISGADVQFLVRFAGDADAVSSDLRLCQSTLHAERQVMP